MNFSDSIQDVLTSLQTWLFANAAALPTDMRDKVAELMGSPSPVDRIVRTGELFYARRADLDDTGLEQCAALISIASNNGWHGLQDEGRGTKIVQAMLRDVGEPAPVGGWPLAEADPEPKAEFVPPVEPEDPPAP